MDIDKLLAGVGLTYEKLTEDELATLTKWTSTIESKAQTVSGIKEYLQAMRDMVEKELVNESEYNYVLWFKITNRKEILLKARLENYLLLLSFLDAPERAKEALSRALQSNIKRKI
jgi:hypothetical protein